MILLGHGVDCPSGQPDSATSPHVLLYKSCLMTGQRQHSCVVRLSVVVSTSEIRVHQIHPLCLARAGSQPRCGSTYIGGQEPGCAYIYMVASLNPPRRFLDLGAMTDAHKLSESATCQIDGKSICFRYLFHPRKDSWSESSERHS